MKHGLKMLRSMHHVYAQLGGNNGKRQSVVCTSGRTVACRITSQNLRGRGYAWVDILSRGGLTQHRPKQEYEWGNLVAAPSEKTSFVDELGLIEEL